MRTPTATFLVSLPRAEGAGHEIVTKTGRIYGSEVCFSLADGRRFGMTEEEHDRISRAALWLLGERGANWADLDGPRPWRVVLVPPPAKFGLTRAAVKAGAPQSTRLQIRFAGRAFGADAFEVYDSETRTASSGLSWDDAKKEWGARSASFPA